MYICSVFNIETIMGNHAKRYISQRNKRQAVKNQNILSVYKKRYKVYDAFIGGFSSVFSIYPSRRVIKLQTADDDIHALASDWMEVGGVIRHAMINYKNVDQ